MGRLISTLSLVAVLAGLGAYIYFVESERPASTGEEKEEVFGVEADALTELRVTAGGETSVLRKVEGTWRLVEPVEAEADQTEASSLATNIASLEINRVVDEQASDLAQYGLAEPAIEIGYAVEGGASGRVAIGDKTATQGDLYAVKPGESRVFLIPAYLESTFNRSTFDLRDKRILRFERAEVETVEIQDGDGTIRLARDGSEWRVTAPIEARADYSAVEAVLTSLVSGTMAAIVEQQPADLATYGLDQPPLTVAVGSGSSRAVLALGRESDGRLYAKDQARDTVFAVDATVADAFRKGVADFREKGLFEFTPYLADRLRIVRGSAVIELQKAPAEGDTPSKWQRVAADGAATDVDSAKIDDVLSKLSNLRVESFEPGAARMPEPELVASVSYDGGRFERVRLGRAGDQVLGSREGEPGIGPVDRAAFDELLQALDGM